MSQNAIVYRWAVAALKENNATLAFYTKLAAHYGTEVRDTQDNIAKATGLHISNVKHHLKVLEDLKIVEKQWIRERGGNAEARKAFRFLPNPPNGK